MDKLIPSSKRQNASTKAAGSDMYQYDILPITFRNQVIYIWKEAVGYYKRPSRQWYGNLAKGPQPVPMNDFWDLVERTIAEENGLLKLGSGGPDTFKNCADYLLSQNTERTLQIIELTFRLIVEKLSGFTAQQRRERLIKLLPHEAIEKLNHRFEQHAIGYRFEAGRIVRVDSQYIHEKVVSPAISLLSDQQFTGALEEFVGANTAYRKGEYKDAINLAEKAFESTLKSICDESEMKYDETATAKNLIEAMVAGGLFPKYFDNILKSGLPHLRNKTTASHGQGKQVVTIQSHIAAYAIHLAAANILFSVAAGKAHLS